MAPRDLDFWDVLVIGLVILILWLMLTVGDHQPLLGGR